MNSCETCDQLRRALDREHALRVRADEERDSIKEALDDMAQNSGKGSGYSGRLLDSMAKAYGAASASDIMRKERDQARVGLTDSQSLVEELRKANDYVLQIWEMSLNATPKQFQAWIREAKTVLENARKS